MITVPQLKNGEQPFDPDVVHAMTPWKEAGMLTLAAADTAADNPAEMTPEERTEMILNLAVVKELVTALHKSEDEALRAMEETRSAAICDIAANHDKFLKEQMAAGENACKNEKQKALFRRLTAAFFEQSRERAKALQQRKTLEYWQKTVEEQNQEFLRRALRPENVVSDDAIAMYRDLILYNRENMLAAAAGTKKTALLQTAKAAFYEKILEKRLENDPAGAKAMAETAEIRTLLGDAACNEFANKAANALREEEIAAKAEAWAEEKLEPAEAEAKAETEFVDEGERKYAVDRYRLARFEENRALLDSGIQSLESAWGILKEAGYDENAIPPGIVRNNLARAVCLRECLRGRGDAGGGEGKAEYGAVMEFFGKFDAEGLWRTLEALRAEEEVYAVVVAAGGSEGELWRLSKRFLLGEAGEEDKEFLAALRAEWGGGQSRERMDFFRFQRKRDGKQRYNSL